MLDRDELSDIFAKSEPEGRKARMTAMVDNKLDEPTGSTWRDAGEYAGTALIRVATIPSAIEMPASGCDVRQNQGEAPRPLERDACVASGPEPARVVRI